MIPDDKLAAVNRALQTAFGTAEFGDVRDLSAGVTMTRVFRIAVRGNPYILRVCTRKDGHNEPGRQFTCMKIAAEAGIAPRVHYTNLEDRISIIDYVERRSLPASAAAAPLASTLRALHALAPFPSLTNDFDTAPTFLLRPTKLRDGVFQRFRDGKILPQSELDQLFCLHERVSAIYPVPDSGLVSSHNDLKPLNILFDGAALCFIDWEAAFLNDPYNDLAVMANYVVTSPAEEDLYLRTYWGEAPGEYRLARFYVMRQLVHMFYALAYTTTGAQGKPIDPNAPVPAFRDIHDRVWSGAENLECGESKIQFARAHLKQLFENAQTARFEEALGIVSKGAARDQDS
jgi:aminoglycoside phosphotransferase (APT) family kinase protein